MTARIRLRRVYDDASLEDGVRVLVDRMWPRGFAKDKAPWDEWMPDVAPSAALRKWYGHDPERFAEFCHRYLAELAEPAPRAAFDALHRLAGDGVITLVTATKDIDHSQAAVLAGQLRRAAAAPESAAGGDPACWARLVCPECSAVITEGHAPGCAAVPGNDWVQLPPRKRGVTAPNHESLAGGGAAQGEAPPN